MSAGIASKGTTPWAAGLVAGVAGLAGLVCSAMFGSSAATDDHADAELLLPALIEDRAMLIPFQALMTVSALALVVFAAGLYRRLAVQEPAGSIAPGVAAGGLGLAAALSLVGAGISTQLWWALGDADRVDPDAAYSMYDLVATMSWVWAGAGLAAATVAISALRHGTFARWIGWVSAVLGFVVLGFSVIPLQYMSGMFGALWLIVTSIGLLVSRRP